MQFENEFWLLVLKNKFHCFHKTIFVSNPATVKYIINNLTTV